MAITKFKDSSITTGDKYGTFSADNNAFNAIDTIFITTTSSSVTFSNIPNYYSHLYLSTALKDNSTAAFGADNVVMYFNGDSSKSYSRNYIRASGGTTTPDSGYVANSFLNFGTAAKNTTGYAEYYGYSWCEIFNYADSDKYKIIRAWFGLDAYGSAASYGQIQLQTGVYEKFAPVTSITIYQENGQSFIPNGRISLYGVL